MLALTLFALLLACIVILRWVPPPTTAFMLEYSFSNSKRPDYRWVSGNDISPYLALAVIASEDQKFPYHNGFDFGSIEKVISQQDHGITRGASTISQQVAKNLFLWPGKNYFRKVIEAGITVLIELLWPKRRIIEVYLNIAEFGNGIYGAGAACTTYFKRSPSTMSREQAARMAAVLPDPEKMHIGNPSPYVQRRVGWIFYQMYLLGGPAYLDSIDYPK